MLVVNAIRKKSLDAVLHRRCKCAVLRKPARLPGALVNHQMVAVRMAMHQLARAGLFESLRRGFTGFNFWHDIAPELPTPALPAQSGHSRNFIDMKKVRTILHY